MFQYYCVVFVLIIELKPSLLNVPIDDPSSFPGHLEPLGSKQNKVDIETLTEYPSPQGS